MRNVLFCICATLFLVACGGNKHKSNPSTTDSTQSLNKGTVEDDYKTLSFDWNQDGIMDTIFFKGIKNVGSDTEWEQTIIKVSNHEPLNIKDDGDFFSNDSVLMKNKYIEKNNQLHTNLAVKLTTDKNPVDDIVILSSGDASGEEYFYIVKIDKKGNPKLIFDQHRDLDNVSFAQAKGGIGLNIIMPHADFINIEEFNWDSVVNGQIPDSYDRVKNENGNILESYNPFEVYRFTMNSMALDSTLSRNYNQENNKLWVNTNNPDKYVVFYKSENDKPIIYKRKDFVKTWNEMK